MIAKRVAHRAVGLEGAVGQQAVEADGHAERADQVHDREDHEVARVQEAAPGRIAPSDHAEERDQHGGDVDVALEAGHALSLGRINAPRFSPCDQLVAGNSYAE